MDSRCYYLPIGNCTRTPADIKKPVQMKPRAGRENREFELVTGFLTREKQILRYQIYQMKKNFDLPTPCTTIHVRRGDAGLPRPPYRRYAALVEYLEKGQVQHNDTIFLMTDDESTIRELEDYPEYHWYYMKRPRVGEYGILGLTFYCLLESFLLMSFLFDHREYKGRI